MSLPGEIFRGLTGYKAAQETNLANQKIAAADRAAAAANQEKGLQSLTGSTPDTTTSRTPEGGFNIDFKGGPGILAEGDIGRAGKVNELTSGYEPIPLSVPRGIVSQERTAQRGLYDEALNKQISALLRQKGGGMENTGIERSIADASGQFALANRLGSERDVRQLGQDLNLAKLNQLQEQILAQSRQAPVSPTGPGGQASNVIAQTPAPRGSINLGRALPWQAITNVATSQMAAETQAERDKKFLDLYYRTLGNA